MLSAGSSLGAARTVDSLSSSSEHAEEVSEAAASEQEEAVRALDDENGSEPSHAQSVTSATAASVCQRAFWKASTMFSFVMSTFGIVSWPALTSIAMWLIGEGRATTTSSIFTRPSS